MSQSVWNAKDFYRMWKKYNVKHQNEIKYFKLKNDMFIKYHMWQFTKQVCHIKVNQTITICLEHTLSMYLKVLYLLRTCKPHKLFYKVLWIYLQVKESQAWLYIILMCRD